MTSSLALLRKEEKDFGKLSTDDFALGAIFSGVSLSSGYVVMKSAEQLVQKLGISNVESYSQFYLHSSLGVVFKNVFTERMHGIIKLIDILYITLLRPIAEEWFFRDLAYKWQEDKNPVEGQAFSRWYLVISNGLIFGSFHFSPGLGWANLLIVPVSIITGIVFALLRELRGDNCASTVAHSLNNSFVMFANFLKI